MNLGSLVSETRNPQTMDLDALSTLELVNRFNQQDTLVAQAVKETLPEVAKAVDAAAEKDPSVRCGIYRFGTKFMVSPFESADMEACALFVRNYSDRFPGLWTYTAR